MNERAAVEIEPLLTYAEVVHGVVGTTPHTPPTSPQTQTQTQAMPSHASTEAAEAFRALSALTVDAEYGTITRPGLDALLSDVDLGVGDKTDAILDQMFELMDANGDGIVRLLLPATLLHRCSALCRGTPARVFACCVADRHL